MPLVSLFRSTASRICLSGSRKFSSVLKVTGVVWRDHCHGFGSPKSMNIPFDYGGWSSQAKRSIKHEVELSHFVTFCSPRMTVAIGVASRRASELCPSDPHPHPSTTSTGWRSRLGERNNLRIGHSVHPDNFQYPKCPVRGGSLVSAGAFSFQQSILSCLTCTHCFPMNLDRIELLHDIIGNDTRRRPHGWKFWAAKRVHHSRVGNWNQRVAPSIFYTFSTGSNLTNALEFISSTPKIRFTLQ